MGIIVQKYGGTSLRDLDKNNNLVKNVRKCVEEGNSLVIVVSAIGREGDPYATDTLINQLNKINTKIDPKKKDLIMSCGETISTTIVSHLLDTEGFSVEPLLGFQAGILTNNNFTDSKIINVNIDNIMKHLNKGKIVVVAGFQGITKDGEITTLGRGGSDTTAVTLGGYLGAEKVEIYTDVLGVAFFDPKLFPSEKYIKNISYENMYNFALSGAKVIHPKAVFAGKNFNVPIEIFSTDRNGDGTLISKIDNDEVIIGGIVKDKENYSTVSILLKESFKDKVINTLKKFNIENKDKIYDIQYLEDRIVYTIDKKYVIKFIQKIYSIIIK